MNLGAGPRVPLPSLLSAPLTSPLGRRTIPSIRKRGVRRLSRDAIVDAYLRVVEQDGDAPTLRRLGDELGADSTAVYRHFRSKDELLAVAADRVLCGIFDDLELTGGWKEDLRALFLALRRAYLQHPQALLALQLDPPELENGFANVERCVDLLLRSGLHREDVPTAYEALETYTIGATLFDARATDESLQRWRKIFAQLPAARFPYLSTTGAELYRDVDQAFAYGLDLMLEAIEARAGAARRDPIKGQHTDRQPDRPKTTAEEGP